MNRKIIALLASLFLCNAVSGQSVRDTQMAKRLLAGSMLDTRESVFFRSKYPWHTGIGTSVFWVGESATAHSPSNFRSSYDPEWYAHAAQETRYYVALPYCDIEYGHTKPDAVNIPWFKKDFKADGVSVLKDKWVQIKHGNRICYGQVKDCGPFVTDHWQYVFGNERPRPNPNGNAGLDVSPAIKTFLGLNGLDVCDWRFSSRIPSGPWTSVH